jgi:hypothetical protein
VNDPSLTAEAPADPRSPDEDAASFVRAVLAGQGGLADYYAEQLAGMDQARDDRLAQPDAIPAAALYYVQQGLRVFPLQPGSKLPLPAALGCCGGSHRHGCTDALADPGAVRAWWREHPDANLGVATGHLVDVIDQDGPDGAISWLRLGGHAPAVLGVATTARGSGGVHRYVRATGRGNGQKIAPGIDYRGAGGYVVAPPSVVNGRRYAWAQPLALTA